MSLSVTHSLYEEKLSMLMSLGCVGGLEEEMVGEEMSEEVKEEVRLVRCDLNSAVRK